MINSIRELEACMNGIPLSGLHDGIYIADITHKPAELKINTERIAGREGDRILQKSWSKAETTISFYLIGNSMQERQAACQQIAEWAKKGTLETSDRPGQRLCCICAQAPTLGGAMQRLRTIEIRFTAYELPFWEETIPTKVTMTGTSGSKSVFIPGNAEGALVEAKASVESGSLTAITLTAGSTSMAFTGGPLANDSNPMEITYDDQLIQSIKRGNTSLIDKRTAASADDLLAKCGAINAFTFSGANVSATVEFSVRGLWL